MKIAKKIYLETEDWRRLQQKVVEAGFKGRGSLSRFLEKIAREPLVFLSNDVKAILSALNLKPNNE